MKQNSNAGSGCALVAALLLGALPFSAQAAHSDDLTVWDENGRVVEYVQASEADEQKNGPSFVYFLKTVRVDQSKFGFPTTLFEDFNDPLSKIGDVFGIAELPGGFFLAFASDTEDAFPFGGITPGAGGNYWEGSQYFFQATQYLAPDLRERGWVAAFRSENALNGIPEPASLSLLALGALGLLSSRKRQKPAA